MSERTLFEGVALTTQEPEAVNALAAYLGKEISSDGVLDLGDVKLVKSNRGDVFYSTSAKGCSCPSFTYRGGPCKHQRRCFAESKPHKGQSMAETLRQADANLSKMPYQYRRMVQAAREEAESEPSLISRGGFRPVMPEDEPKSSSPIAEMLIDAYAPTTLPGEIEYWNQKAKMEA